MTKKTKVTYATLPADNEELQSAFDNAVRKVEQEWLGGETPMFINGKEVFTEEKLLSYSPIDTSLKLCSAQKGEEAHARSAIKAAKEAFPAWRKTSWMERVETIRRIADHISDNVFELSALVTLEVGKSRLESLGEVEETADLLRYYAASMEQNNGFHNRMGKMNPDDPTENNFSILRPYGAWVVIAPFNFPMALAAAPIAAALIAGNTVIYKGSSETLYSDWKTAELFVQAGLPAGVFNYVSGPGSSLGLELQNNPDVDGWTFTGSYKVGMQLFRQAASGIYPKPAVIEMGGKNPTIVSDSADAEKAANGVVRAAFGLNGQKCSACSRVYVQEGIYETFKSKLIEKTQSIIVSDPTERNCFMGTVINKAAYDDYKAFMETARRDGNVLIGGNQLSNGEFAKGYYVEPAIIEGLPEYHELVKNELFLPILTISKVKTLEEAMEKANNTPFGLTAGFFGEDEGETEWFFENIQAGTTFSNRPSGATTGAWPGVQAFGGWKGSGSSGKAIGSLYTLSLYMHEQSRTIIG